MLACRAASRPPRRFSRRPPPSEAQAHFLRCIKPNAEKQPTLFTPRMVLDQARSRPISPRARPTPTARACGGACAQLRCSGTIDAVGLMAGGYPTRIPYASIHGRYAHLMPDFVQRLPPPLFCESLALALEIKAGAFALSPTAGLEPRHAEPTRSRRLLTRTRGRIGAGARA